MGEAAKVEADVMRQHHAIEALLDSQQSDQAVNCLKTKQLMVGRASALLARTLGIELALATDIGHAARLKDIGLTCLPPMISNTQNGLNPAELALYRQHPVQGARLLSLYDGRFFQLAATICRNAHERVDGSGWPSGVHGRLIPLEAKIVSVASTYVGLRLGVQHASHQQAMTILTCGDKDHTPEQFDDRVLWAMVEAGSRLGHIVPQ